MITIEEMIKSDGENVNIYYTDGEILKNVYVIEYIETESEEEENCLELDKILVLQSEIEKIEILD
ncbi:hypothetical protein ACF3OF_01870 [Sneathia vaginalis]|uniref:hypothetical protein n=1 Tax=Sneathia vaginalis TaxID=187101 RepID=UPI00370DB729